MKIFVKIAVIVIGLSPGRDLIPIAFSKKINKEIEKTWSITDFSLEEVSLDSLSETSSLNIFKVSSGNNLFGYVYLTKAKGRFDYFDYMILFNKKLKIEKVKVLRYVSEYGGEISGKSWLKQFIGLQSEEVKYGDEIQAISGATISGNAITEGINTACKIMQEHFSTE